MKNNKIDPNTKSEIINICHNVLKENKKTLILQYHQKILERLPEPIKKQISYDLFEKINLKNFPLFSKNFSADSLQKIPKFFTKKKFHQNQNILTEGSLDDKSLFLIVKGKAIICLPLKEETMKIKKKYDIIGFENFFGDKPMSFTVKALTKKVTVLKLSQNDFLRVVKENQEDYDKFCEIRDKIQLQMNFEDLNMNCKLCFARNHDETHCPLILRIFNKKFHIQKLSFYQENNNKRLPYSSRKKNKTRFLISKKALIINFQEKYFSKSDFDGSENDEIEERFFSSSLEDFIRKSMELDKINLKRKENYFPQNHYKKIIYEYNEMISNKRKEKENSLNSLFFFSNFSVDIASRHNNKLGIGFDHIERKNS